MRSVLALQLRSQLLELLLQRADGIDRLTLGLPVLLHLCRLSVECGELVGQRGEPGDGCRIGHRVAFLGLQRDLLDLELQDAPLDDVDLRRHRVDLDAQLAGRLVDEIDRLVRQEAVREIAVGQHGSGDERGVLDAHAVMHLIALLEAAQDADRVLDRRLGDVHLLEAPFEGGVLLDALAVLVERGRPDHAQLAASEHRLDHVAGVHRSLGGTGPDDRVQLIDERDDLAGGVGDLLEHRLQPLLELAAVLRPGDHRADVEGDEALGLQTLGHIAVGDAPGEPLDDGGLADAWLADQHGVVLRPAREHLDHAADLVVAPDDRVDLALTRPCGEVLSVALEGLELVLGVLRRHPMRPADILQHLEQLLGADAEAVVHRQQQVLDGQEVVAQVGLDALGGIERGAELTAHARLVAAIRLGQLGDGLVGAVADHQRRLTELGQHGRDDGVVLPRQRGEQVIRRQLGVGVGLGLIDGGGHRLLSLERPLLGVERHATTIPSRRKLESISYQVRRLPWRPRRCYG